MFKYKLIISFSVISKSLRVASLRGRIMVRRLTPCSMESLPSGRGRRVLRWDAVVDDECKAEHTGDEVDANRGLAGMGVPGIKSASLVRDGFS